MFYNNDKIDESDVPDQWFDHAKYYIEGWNFGDLSDAGGDKFDPYFSADHLQDYTQREAYDQGYYDYWHKKRPSTVEWHG